MSSGLSAVLARVVVLAALAGVAVFGGVGASCSGSTLPATNAGESARFPAFEMTREVTTSAGTSVFHLVYENDTTWKETLLSSTIQAARSGDYQELRDGKFVVFALGREHVEDPGLGYRVPGPWFGDAQWFIRRGKAADSATLTTETIGPDLVVTIALGAEWTEIRFDDATGIPVSFERRTAGDLVERHEVTSLTTAEGQTIR